MNTHNYNNHNNRECLYLLLLFFVAVSVNGAKAQNKVDNSISIVKADKSKPDKVAVTQAIAVVTGEELMKSHTTSLGAALAGRLPGLIVETSQNMPGSESFSYKVRGVSTSRADASPLIIIDGMIADNFNHINPVDVKSVTVYKDAAAAIYGMQGGNGVIAIATKRGETGASHIKVNADYTLQAPIKTPHMLNSWQYATLMNQANKNDGNGDYFSYSQNEIDKFQNGTDSKLYPNNNWYDKYMKPVVQTQNINISATGGSKSFKYYSNIGYMHQEYPYKTDNTQSKDFGLHRFQVRSNADVKVNDFINGFMNIAARIQSNTVTKADNSSIYTSLFELSPATYGPLTDDNKVIVTPEVVSPTYGRLNRSGYLRALDAHVTANIGLNFDLDFITKGLSAQGTVNFYTYALSNINGTKDYERWTRDLTSSEDLEFVRFGTTRDEPLSLTKNVKYRYMSDFSGALDYVRSFGNHNINANIFGRYQYDNPQELTQIQPLKRITFGAKLSYSYKDWVFVDMVSSTQATDQLKKGNRYGTFPSFSAGIVLNNIDNLESLFSPFSLFKLRASYGITGTDNLTNYLYRETLDTSSGGYISELGDKIQENRLPNENLTWEKNKITNFGIDLEFKNNISFSFDYFNEDHTDILTLANTLTSSMGIPTTSLPYLNNGHTTNTGFDITIGYRKDLSKDLSFSVQGNLGYAKNKIKNINEVSFGDDYAYKYHKIGYSVGELWGYKVDYSNGNGFFNSQEEIAKSGLTYEGVAPRPGDLIFQDLNDDKIINAKDMAPMGKTDTPKYNWGINLNMKWKNFDLTALFQGLSDYATFNTGLGFNENINNGIFFSNHLTAWSSERYASGERITAPALSLSNTSSRRSSDYYLRDKSFARLKNLELGYILPVSTSKKISASQVRIYASGVNLLTFEKDSNKDFDVEMAGMGVYPTNRFVTFGLSVMF